MRHGGRNGSMTGQTSMRNGDTTKVWAVMTTMRANTVEGVVVVASVARKRQKKKAAPTRLTKWREIESVQMSSTRQVIAVIVRIAIASSNALRDVSK
jgi:hypothetical protein